MISVILMDCPGPSDAEKRDLEDKFCDALMAVLGDDAERAYAAYDAAVTRWEETPLPEGASDEERAAVDRWLDAEAEATRAAFADWIRIPDAAHFEVAVSRAWK